MRKFLPARALRSYQIIVERSQVSYNVLHKYLSYHGHTISTFPIFCFLSLRTQTEQFYFLTHTVSFHYVVAGFRCWWSVFKSEIVTLGTHYQGSEWFSFSASPCWLSVKALGRRPGFRRLIVLPPRQRSSGRSDAAPSPSSSGFHCQNYSWNSPTSSLY